MKKINLYIFIVLVWCNAGFAAPIAYGKWEPAKYYLELRFNNIKSRSDGVCKNPLIRWGVSKADSLPFNCDNIETIYAGLLEDFDHVEEVCSQKS